MSDYDKVLLEALSGGTVGGMQNISSLVVLAHLAMQAESLPGDLVEFGCAEGRTARLLATVSTKLVHVYDSFNGLPTKDPLDGNSEQFVEGAIRTLPETVIATFEAGGLEPPVIHSGWFCDLTDSDMPEQVAFAFLDCDFYHSMLDALALVYPKLSPGAALVVHDYHHHELPGVKVACDQFMDGKPEKLEPVYGAKGYEVFRMFYKL